MTQAYFELAIGPHDTRSKAAESIEPLRANMFRQVLDFIADRGERGAIDEEIAEGLGMRQNSARARRVELRNGSQVRNSGRRRQSTPGRLCIVWTATAKPLT